jgi:sugar lactone lactonase YvrE
MRYVLALVLLSGCGDNAQMPPLPDLSMQAAMDMSVPPPVDMAVARGPISIPLHFEPDGLWWDPATHKLYIANDGGNQIVTWDDSGQLAVFALLPLVNSGGGLGQLVKLSDGTFLVTRFGGGINGGIVYVKTDGTTGLISGLDPKRRRVGLTVASDGTIYDTYFGPGATPGSHVGAVASVTMAGVETDVVTGLQKPVGVLALAGQLYISDQDQGIVFTQAAGTPGTGTQFALAAGCDLVAAGPNGALFAGGKPGVVYRINSDMSVTEPASGDRAIRGVAYDPDGKRLFFAEPDGTFVPDAGEQAALHIIPIDN